MNARRKRQNRRWQKNPEAYWKALYRIVKRDMKHEKGYLYIDVDENFDWQNDNIWAHELKLPVLFRKGGKP